MSSAALAKRASNRVAHILLNVLLALMLALAAAVVVIPRMSGAVPLTVLTGSMLPTIRPGDLVVVRPTPVTELRLGDIVTFQPVSGVATLVTHRIIAIERDGGGQVTAVQTQGDANNVPDNLLVPDQVMGRVWYTVPFIGQLANGRNSLLLISAIGVGLVVYAVSLFAKKEDDEEATEPEPPKAGRHLKAQIEALSNE